MKKNTKGTFIVIGVVAIIAVLVYAVFFKTPQTTIGAGASVVVPGATNNIVTVATALTFVPVDAIYSGTATAGTAWVKRDGATEFTAGLATADQGDNLEVLYVNNTAYHNAYIKSHIVPNGKTTDTIPVKLYRNGSLSINLYNTNGDLMTNGSTGATNQTVTSAGQAFNLGLRFDGTDGVGTQDLRCVIEETAGSNTSKITLSMPGAVAVPGNPKPVSYTLAGTGSSIWVFDVPAIVGATTVKGTLGVQSASTRSLSASNVTVACFSKEYFIDTNGMVSYAIEDANGVLQSMTNAVPIIGRFN